MDEITTIASFIPFRRVHIRVQSNVPDNATTQFIHTFDLECDWETLPHGPKNRDEELMIAAERINAMTDTLYCVHVDMCRVYNSCKKVYEVKIWLSSGEK